MVKEMKPSLTAESWAGSRGRDVDGQQRSSMETGSRSPRTKAALPTGSPVIAGPKEVSLMKEEFLDSRKGTEPSGWNGDT